MLTTPSVGLSSLGLAGSGDLLVSSPRPHDLKPVGFLPFQEAELQRVQKVRELELVYARAQLELEVSKAQQLAEVEAKKFKQMTEALGPSTIRDLAVAGPEMQVRLGGQRGRGGKGTSLGTKEAKDKHSV
jgi:hypothetical protein